MAISSELSTLASSVSGLKIVLILTFGFGLASLLGYISTRLHLSSILGYLIAGYLIGPYSPGFVADREISDQLAEIGLILMMFSVGLHFKWQDLVKVRRIAIPGAFVQTLVAMTVCALFIRAIGCSWQTGILVGLAVAVASTVVLMRQLTESNLLKSLEGHIAVGWLVVEDVITVLALLMLPSISYIIKTETVDIESVAFLFGSVIVKFAILVAAMFTVGQKVVKYILSKVVRTRSRELFTLTILALTFLIATGSTYFFGTSIALGAFIAGMIIGQTDVRHQVSANATPLKDAFVVLFFLSVGMLFNPLTVIQYYLFFLAVLAIVLLFKPMAAIFITLSLKYPLKTALTLGVALAQIGEFSFILSESALRLNLISQAIYDIIVACALVSIAINPLLFKWAKVGTHAA